MFNIFRNKKDVLLDDMMAVYNGLIAAGEGRKQYAQDWINFAKLTKEMLMIQNPSLELSYDKAIEYFTQIAECQNRLALAEIRNAEDFRDVSERFSVVYRCNQEYNESKRIFRETAIDLQEAEAKLQVEKSKPNNEKVQQKLEGQVESLKEKKQHELDTTKQLLRKLIEERNKYNQFKVRRFTQGWTTYANALQEESEKESVLLEQAQSFFEDLAQHLEAGTYEELNKRLQEQLAKEPAPAIDVSQEQTTEN